MLILAGGFGTRLRSVVSEVPKPLAPVDGEPFLVHLIQNLIAQGAKEFILLLHYKAEAIKQFMEQRYSMSNSEIIINYIIETKPLGTGGSVSNALKLLKIRNSFIVVNGDTWLGDGYKELCVSPPNTIAVVRSENTTRYGRIEIENGFVKQFFEKDKFPLHGYINAGMYHLAPDLFINLKYDLPTSLERDIFQKLIEANALRIIEIDSDFKDIGIPKDYFEFCEWIESGRKNEIKP